MTAQQRTGKELALIKQQTADIVANRVRKYQESGELHLPEKYSAENAVKAAWLILQETVDRNKVPALQVCTKVSIANAMLDMVVQALNPMKNQCYFIVYGKQLACQRSYFGNMAIVKRVEPTIKDVVAEIVYHGDTFEYEILNGRKSVVKHTQSLGNIDNGKIAAAYAVILNKDESVRHTEIMTWDQIKKAWAQSKMKPITDKGEVKPGGTHDKFTAEMAKKTAINRACKTIINSSDDSDLFLKTIKKADELAAEEQVLEEIEESGNKDFIDIDPEPDPGPGRKQELEESPMTEEEIAEIQMEEQKSMDEAPY